MSATTEGSTSRKPRCAVVGIGASAGGLDAFSKFFSAIPADTGMVFVLIQHLDPTHESLTAELLGRHTAMSVVQATDEMTVEPNHVYVIPPNRYLTISGDTLHLTEPIERRGIRVPIDFFFRSLADDQRERAIGVILSGTGTDGTFGAEREIKAAGGMVMVQDPRTAQHGGMPRSVIAAGVVDYMLPVERMPDTLNRYVRHWYVNEMVAPVSLFEQSTDNLTAIIGLLRAQTKYDFSCYKKGTLTRRIQRRMGLLHVEDMSDYVATLRRDKEEANLLYKDLLIGVTNFFREPEAWQELQEQVIEPLVSRIGTASQGRRLDDHDPHTAGGKHDQAIRVWVPGCATGEEPYSIAMLVNDALNRAEIACHVNLFASDIDQEALSLARAGVYPENIAADVPPDRLRRFFTKGEHTYRINKEIRELVVFAEQNVISDPPFSKLDLISCRNLLIYLEPEVQQSILAMFHFALRDGGYLFLGNAEAVGQQQDLFEAVSRKWRIYRRVGSERRYWREVPVRPVATTGGALAVAAEGPDRRSRHLTALAQQAILQRFGPACVLVNKHADILYLSGPVDDYLQLPSGEPELNLIATARSGLRTRLRTALTQASRDHQPVVLEEVRIKRGQKYFPIRLSIESLPPTGEHDGLLLVAFDEAAAENRVRVVYVEPPEDLPVDKPVKAHEYETVIRHLEGELMNARDELQTTVEELETSNEEFKAANEEVTSINEELQSTNEELETSKEELQSLNEELQTVNSQLETKLAELEVTNNDLHNLLASIDHATLLLDRGFHIRRFTAHTTRLLRVIETDIGRPFSDFAKTFSDPQLIPDAEQVLLHLSPIDREVPDEEGLWYVRRIVPYRSEDDRIDGVVITFTDITQRKRYEREIKENQRELLKLNESLEEEVAIRTKELLESEERFRSIVENTTAGIALIDTDTSFIQVNEAFCRLLDYHKEELLKLSLQDVTHADDWSEARHLLEEAAKKRISAIDIEQRDIRRDGTTGWGHLSMGWIFDAEGEARYAVGMVQDISQRKALQREVLHITDEQQSRIGRDLHDSIGQQLTGLGYLAQTLVEHVQKYHDQSMPALELAGLIETVTKLAGGIGTTLGDVQKVSRGLVGVKPESSGLMHALHDLTLRIDAMENVTCAFKCEVPVEVSDNVAATHLYRIAQEAVSNALKHGHAKHILIELKKDDTHLTMQVANDGKTFDSKESQARGMGLRTMRYRASLIGASLTIQPAEGGGTLVRCDTSDPLAGI